MTKLGGIETTGTFGGWNLVDASAEKLPQDVASAIYGVFDGRDEKINPVWYFGYQLVNGMNHSLVCARERTQNEKVIKDYVNVVINIPPKVEGYKEATLLKMEVAEETILSSEAKQVFDATAGKLTGTTHKPLLEVGKQVVKGVNFHIICQSQTVYTDEKPYLTRIVLNRFCENMSTVEIQRID